MTGKQLGMELRDQGAERVLRVESSDWKEAAEVAIRYLASRKVPFTADDVRELTGDPERVNSMGAAFRAAARAGIVEEAGFTVSARPEGHARAMRVWMGVAA